MVPAVRIVLREAGARLFPVPPLDFFQKVGRMQAHLPFRLPQPEQPQRPKREHDPGGKPIFAKQHE